MKISLYIILLSLILVGSCKQSDNIESYLFQKLNLPTKGKNNVYIINLDGCDNCISRNLNFLKEQSLPLTLVLVGTTKKQQWLRTIDMLSKTYEIIRDPKSIGIKMRINLSKPLLVITMTNQIVAQVNVDDAHLDKLSRMLINDANLTQAKLNELMK